jgi:hypothetical protein
VSSPTRICFFRSRSTSRLRANTIGSDFRATNH